MVLPWWFEPVALTSLAFCIISTIVTVIIVAQYDKGVIRKVSLIFTYVLSGTTILCAIVALLREIWSPYL